MYQTLRLIVAAAGIAFCTCLTSAPADMSAMQIISDHIELVKKHYDKTDVTIVVGYDSESRSSSSVVRTIRE
jgi:hypothetical protein